MTPGPTSFFRYNDEQDEHRATNLMFVCEEDFSRVEVMTVGVSDNPHSIQPHRLHMYVRAYIHIYLRM